jgi:hypothetical protein
MTTMDFIGIIATFCLGLGVTWFITYQLGFRTK